MIIVGVCREDKPQDVDEAYGEGTYARLFPMCEGCGDIEPLPGKALCSMCEEEERLAGRYRDPKFDAGNRM